MAQSSSDSQQRSPTPRVRVREVEDYDHVTQPSFHVEYSDAGSQDKNDKLRKNPMVPISAAATAAILAGGLYQFKRGNAIWSQRLMRARVFAQGTTLALLAGSVYQVKAESPVDSPCSSLKLST